jgi:hypothetical protein
MQEQALGVAETGVEVADIGEAVLEALEVLGGFVVGYEPVG